MYVLQAQLLNSRKATWTSTCNNYKPTIIPIVQEHYLALKQREATRPFYEMRSFVKVRGVNVPITDISIFQYYDTPYY
ncbi:hypothetical protein Gotri_012682 [Gossypium trilobum]|uniref:Uncharacterized protein n=1 Tax=Gossypium trilobum TaxID=34281 RepID=A0A7J9DR37_9ROSI|nr:hypothetical protein [Gossypium trilobum]